MLYLTRGGEISGEQRQLLYLLRGLDRSRYRPWVLCTEDGPFRNELRDLGIPCQVHPLAGWRKSKHILRRYRDAAYVRALVRDNGVSLVHCSSMWLSPYALRAVRNTNIPWILHVRAPLTAKRARQLHCRHAASVIVISTRVQRRLIQMRCVPEDRIVLIHDAVDSEVFQPLGTASPNVLKQQYDVHDKILIGLVGRIEPDKDQLSFVKIAREVLDNTRQAAFFLVGQMKDQSYVGQIEEYTRSHGLSDHVYFTGRRNDIADVLGSLDVLVSLTGGSVRYEAMMCGLPVVCAWSRTPEESYHIRHNDTGFLVTERDTGAVAHTLLQVIADGDLRKTIGANAKRWARAHLSHEQLVQDTQALYDQLLGENLGSRSRVLPAATGNNA